MNGFEDNNIHKSFNKLGISAYYHDGAETFLRDGEVIAAAREEQFCRQKHNARFPLRAIRHCLKETELGLCDLDQIVFYD